MSKNTNSNSIFHNQLKCEIDDKKDTLNYKISLITNDFIEEESEENFHIEKINVFYNNYIKALKYPENNPELIKRTFDDYISFIYQDYVKKIDSIKCNEMQESQKKVNYTKCEMDNDHEKFFKKQKYDKEHYNFFKILDYVWKAKDNNLSDIEILSPCKMLILRSLVKRKFEYEIDLGNSIKIQNSLKKLKTLKSKKRVEENMKFLLKKCFKFIISYKYKNKEDSSDEIFNDWFKDKISLDIFHKIFILKKKSCKNQITIKKLNSSIVTMLFKIPDFENLFKFYCDNFLLKECDLEISWKIFMLTKKWRKLVKTRHVDIFKDICFEIENDKKFKIPWTRNEILEAIQYVYQNLLKLN